ncbi:sigma factor-like helix-turn-helix DNA-binding protein [Paenibacillus sp. IHBB 3054]|uniref:sigma factor-like helix-turn-helix DNA-binding protein n=1 Tax=Paenibacillus sp. IHBB 3054 TaxID=3425689 RepID=UPI003F66BC4D
MSSLTKTAIADAVADMTDTSLLTSYEDTKSNLNKKIAILEKQLEPLKEKLAAAGDKQERDTIRQQMQPIKLEKNAIAASVSDLEYSIEWMQTGYPPGYRRPMERRSISQRTKVWDPQWMEYLTAYEFEFEPAEVGRPLTMEEEWKIEDALRNLSERERQCYVLHHAIGMSLQSIANEMDIKKGSVQVMLRRADQKIDYNKANNLFLLCM